MLALDYQFIFVNNLGVDMDLSSNSGAEIIDLDLRKWKITSAGVLEYQAETNLTYSAADIANGGYAAFTSGAQDNSTDLRHGLFGYFRYQTDDASAAGTVDLFVEYSTDGGSTFPSGAADFVAEADLLGPVASIDIAGDGAGYIRAVSFEL